VTTSIHSTKQKTPSERNDSDGIFLLERDDFTGTFAVIITAPAFFKFGGFGKFIESAVKPRPLGLGI
jgi:hypothetical protein